jgi:hypothetical protein
VNLGEAGFDAVGGFVTCVSSGRHDDNKILFEVL